MRRSDFSEATILLTIALLFRILHLLDGNLLYDDSFITFRYANNIAAGNGFVYNLNEFVMGVTTPLWAVILAMAKYLGVDTPTAAVAFGIGLDLIVVILLYTVAKRVNKLAGFFTALVWTAYPPAISAATGGMETTMFVALTLLALSQFGPGKSMSTVSLSSVASLACRPEGIITYLMALGRLISDWRKNLLWITAAVLLPGGLALLVYAYFGSVIPHSVTAKLAYTGGGTSVGKLLFGLFPGETIILLPPALLGILYLAKRRSLPIVIVWTAIYLIAYLVARPKMWVWYYLPAQLGIVLLGGIGVSYAVQIVSSLLHVKRRRSLLPVKIASLVLVLCIGSYYYRPTGTAGQNEESRRFREVAEYVKTMSPSNGRVLVSDIGYVGYYSGRYIMDAWGLVWKPALQFEGPVTSRIPRIAESYRPDVVVIPASKTGWQAVNGSSWFTENYKLGKIFSDRRLNPDSVSSSDLADSWVSEYLVYVIRESTN
jgi:arabinofuranosyltransferase